MVLLSCVIALSACQKPSLNLYLYLYSIYIYIVLLYSTVEVVFYWTLEPSHWLA